MTSEPITSPKLAGHGPKVCLGIIHLFGEIKDGLGKGQIKEKRITITIMCTYTLVPWAISTQVRRIINNFEKIISTNGNILKYSLLSFTIFFD